VDYIRRNAVSIFRIYAMYEPLRVFMTAAVLVGLIAPRSGAASSGSSSRATAPATSSR
jgi:hypothetical protein